MAVCPALQFIQLLFCELCTIVFERFVLPLSLWKTSQLIFLPLVESQVSLSNVEFLVQPMVNHFEDMEIEDSLSDAFGFLFQENDK